MKKVLFLILLLLGIGVVIYVTFIKAMFELAIGVIFLAIMAIALLALWFMWKKKKKD